MLNVELCYEDVLLLAIFLFFQNKKFGIKKYLFDDVHFFNTISFIGGVLINSVQNERRTSLLISRPRNEGLFY